MSKNLIYCFSGSGNCLFIAKKIAECLHDADIVMMRKKPVVISSDGYDTVGFVYPCYGGGLPLGVREKLNKLAISFNCYTYAVCSYAGYIGCGNREIDSVIPLDYWSGISHHCSCNWLFPHKLMLPPLSVESANRRAERLARNIADDVMNRVKMKKDVPKKLLNKAEHIAWPFLAKQKAKTFLVGDSCVNCGLCIELCPKGNIATGADGNIVIGNNCIQCLSCVQFCPEKAISIGGSSNERYHNPEISARDLTRTVIHID